MIRQARSTDFDTMAAIWLEASKAGHPFLGEAVLLKQLTLVRDVYFPQAESWVAEEYDTVVGFIGMLGNHIGGLFIRPREYRRGIGRKLVGHAASRLGQLTVEVYERNPGAIAFYASCGFVLVGRKETDDEGRPFPLLCMSRPG